MAELTTAQRRDWEDIVFWCSYSAQTAGINVGSRGRRRAILAVDARLKELEAAAKNQCRAIVEHALATPFDSPEEARAAAESLERGNP